MALEIVNGTLQRVYFFEGDRAWVRCPPANTTEFRLPDENTYVEIKRGCVIEGPFGISAATTPEGVKRFAAEVTEIAKAAQD